MLRAVIFAAIILFPGIASSRQDTLCAKTAVFQHKLPQKNVSVLKTMYGTGGLNFLVLHDDENTGLQAAQEFCKLNGGRITELQYGNDRNIKGGSSKASMFSFDPNQMFNDAGAVKTLQKYSYRKPGQMIVDRVRQLAISVLNAYDPDSTGYILTLHNNTDGNFDIHSYEPGQYLFGTADSVYINAGMDADDLVFVTERRFFDYLKQQQINAVLQSSKARDGSLSVYAQSNGVPYINIEVQDGHYEEHFRLIVAVKEMISDSSPEQLYAKQK